MSSALPRSPRPRPASSPPRTPTTNAAAAALAVPAGRKLHAAWPAASDAGATRSCCAGQQSKRSLSVFAGAGRWTRPRDRGNADDMEVLDLLGHLADKSLVVVARDPRRRRATACWRRSGNTGRNDWPKRARPLPRDTGTSPSSWRWPSAPTPSASPGGSLGGAARDRARQSSRRARLRARFRPRALPRAGGHAWRGSGNTLPPAGRARAPRDGARALGADPPAARVGARRVGLANTLNWLGDSAAALP